MSERKVSQCYGVLIVLDVLGWQNGKSALNDKWQLVTDIALQETQKAAKTYPQFKGTNYIAGVYATDSYLIGAWRNNKEIDENLVAFAAVTANALFAACWQWRLALRGCLSIGAFTASSDPLRVTGEALLDAHSEVDSMNWSGCHATTKANKILDNFVPKYKVLTNAFADIIDPPYKDKSLSGQRWVLNWAYAFFHQPDEPQLRATMKKELSDTKNENDRAKHEFTRKFFEKVYAALEDREKKRKEQT